MRITNLDLIQLLREYHASACRIALGTWQPHDLEVRDAVTQFLREVAADQSSPTRTQAMAHREEVSATFSNLPEWARFVTCDPEGRYFAWECEPAKIVNGEPQAAHGTWWAPQGKNCRLIFRESWQILKVKDDA